MRHIYIDEEEIKIQDVVAVLKQSTEFDALAQHYSDLLLALKLILGTNESTLEMCLVLLKNKGTAGALTDILDEWARKQERNAQLHTFIAIISNLKLWKSANLLQTKFFDERLNSYSVFVGLEAAEMQNLKNKEFEQMDTERDVFLQNFNKKNKPQQIRNRFPKKDVRPTGHLTASQNAKPPDINTYRNWMLSHTLNLIQIILLIISTLTIIYCLPNAWGKIDVLLRETFVPKVEDLSRMGTRSAIPRVLNISTGSTQKITASSYIEYQKGLLNVPDDGMLEVYINLQDTGSWPNDVAFQNAGSIKKLVVEGKMETHTILYILEKTSNLMEFELIDSYNGLCSNIERTKNMIGSEANNIESHLIVLNKLHTLKLTNFGKCGGTYKLFADHIFMSNLSSFYLTNGLVDSITVGNIQDLLRIHANSITEMHFSKTNWSVSLHDQNFPKLPNVRKIHIDSIQSSSCPELSTIITAKFRYMYPNVEIFSSTNGCILWDHLPRILESSSLHSLTTGVEIPSDMESVKIGFLKNYDFSLHFVEMYLFFPNKTKTDVCTVEGLSLVKEKIKILLDANCSLK